MNENLDLDTVVGALDLHVRLVEVESTLQQMASDLAFLRSSMMAQQPQRHAPSGSPFQAGAMPNTTYFTASCAPCDCPDCNP